MTERWKRQEWFASRLTSNNLYNGGSSLRADIRWSSFRGDIQTVACQKRDSEGLVWTARELEMLDRCFGNDLWA